MVGAWPTRPSAWRPCSTSPPGPRRCVPNVTRSHRSAPAGVHAAVPSAPSSAQCAALGATRRVADQSWLTGAVVVVDSPATGRRLGDVGGVDRAGPAHLGGQQPDLAAGHQVGQGVDERVDEVPVVRRATTAARSPRRCRSRRPPCRRRWCPRSETRRASSTSSSQPSSWTTIPVFRPSRSPAFWVAVPSGPPEVALTSLLHISDLVVRPLAASGAALLARSSSEVDPARKAPRRVPGYCHARRPLAESGRLPPRSRPSRPPGWSPSRLPPGTGSASRPGRSSGWWRVWGSRATPTSARRSSTAPGCDATPPSPTSARCT